MTPRQKRIIAIMAIADIVVILALAVLVTHPSGTGSSPLPTPALRAEDLAKPSRGASTLSGSAELTGEAPRPEDFEPGRTARPEGSTEAPHGEASASEAPPQGTCQWKGTQMLAQAGLGGTVALTPDGSLRFEIVYSLPPGETADEAAQSVWVAFDVALALQEQENECSSFTRVEVTILAVRLGAHGEAGSSQADTRISASVSAADLVAFGAGELSESEFIERVAYTTSRLP